MDINSAWKSTCKVVLGDEIGELEEYENYLKKFVEPNSKVKSSLSGIPTTISADYPAKDAKFIRNDEAKGYSEKLGKIKFNLNDIKDIDSALASLSEVFCYSGDIVLGNSKYVENSTRCSNVYFVKDSHDISDGKYVAYSSMMRFCNYIFGSNLMGENDFMLKVFHAYKCLRCMESTRVFVSNDCYYSANLEGCKDCMFSFNQKNKSFMMGNLQLSREEYLKLKAKLLEDIRDNLKARKEITSISEIILGKNAGRPPSVSMLFANGQKRPYSSVAPAQNEVEKAFSVTAQILFGRQLSPLGDYEDWLLGRARINIIGKSAISGKPVPATPFLINLQLRNAFITLEESVAHGEKRIHETDAKKLRISNAQSLLNGIMQYNPEVMLGENHSMLSCVNYENSSNCYGGSTYFAAKNCALCSWARADENVFGSDMLFYSKFCFKCYHSYNLTRCFEVSDSRECSDSYFCHNIENCSECMFCFNVKNLKYAIGNVEHPREEYLNVKARLLRQFADELEKTHSLKYDIYNIGCARKN